MTKEKLKPEQIKNRLSDIGADIGRIALEYIAELEGQNKKMKRCKICKHYQWGSCNYHSNWVKDCKENGMKLFELKETDEND